MEAETDRMMTDQDRPSLQMKRSLLPIDEYAARQGLSIDLVEKCGDLGIVQIRKYKGKTFVVNSPVSPYPCAAEPPDEPLKSTAGPAATGTASRLVKSMFSKAARIVDKPAGAANGGAGWAKNSHRSARKIQPEAHKSASQARRFVKHSDEGKNVSQSVRTITPPSRRAVNEPARAAERIRWKETLPPVKPPDMELFEIDDEPGEVVDDSGYVLAAGFAGLDEMLEIEETPESVQIPQNDGYRFGILAAGARSTRNWQLAALFLVSFLFVALFAAIWLYADREIQVGRLGQANASLEKLSDGSEQVEEEVQVLQRSLSRSQEQVELLRKEVDASRAQIKGVQNELLLGEQDRETIRNELGKSRAEVGHLRGELGSSEAEVSRLQNELDEAEAELKSIKAELARAKQSLRNIQRRNAEAAARLNRRIQELAAQRTE
jgi:hypothetical protein